MFDKIKQLSKDTAVYGISTMLGRFLSFLLVPFYTHVFNTKDYGIISNIYAYIALLNIFYIYGMDAAYMKFSSLREIGDDKDNFSTPFYSVVFSSVIFSLLMILFRGSMMAAMSIPEKYSYLIYYIAIILLLDALAVIPFIKLRLDRKGKTFALYKFFNIVINVAFNFIFIVGLKWGIESVLLSNILASLFSLLVVLPVITKNIKPSFHKGLFKKLLKFGLPYLPAGLGSMIIQVIDRPIMEKLTDLSTLGIYQASYKLGIFMMLFVTMFQFAWQPFFLEESKGENAKQIFSKVLTYFTLAGSFILVLVSLFVSDLITIHIFGRTIFAKAYLSGLYIVPVILLGYLFNGMYVVFNAGIFIKDKSIYVPVMTGIGAIVNVGVNFLLIPVWGMMGAAIATFAAYLSMAAGIYIVTQKFYKIEYETGKIIKIFIAIIITGGIYYALMLNGNLLFIYKLGLLVLFSSMIYFFVIDKNEVAFIRKKLLRR
jgi:O-antigen/teichoic acid export membrane protein